jgi:potassium-dependent mechanosensitive channel
MEETGTPITSPFDIIVQQIETLLIFIQRPAVQRQIIAFILILFVAYVLARLLRAFIRRITGYHPDHDYTQSWRRWIPEVGLLYFPLIGLALTQLVITIFTMQGYRYGMLNDLNIILWVLFAYRIIVTAAYTIFGEEAILPYQRFFLNPLFVVLVGARILSNVLNLSLIGQIELTNILETPIRVGNVFGALLILYIATVISWTVRDALRSLVLPRMETNPGAVNSVLTLTRYIILAIGIFASLASLGFNLTTLAVIGGGLSVGIGFGLQQIISNFISGVVLLFEQSLRPGDIIDIEGKLGVVQRLSIRSTKIKTYDNIEIIVPNEKFLTTSVTTYTGTEHKVRASLHVGASYDSDPKEVRRILLEAAESHGLILAKPKPNVLFLGYGASSIDFRLDFWVESADRIVHVRSDLYYIVWEAFERHEIEIPFPQHDLNLRRGWDLLQRMNDSDSKPEIGQATEADVTEQTEVLQPKPEQEGENRSVRKNEGRDRIFKSRP